MGDSVKKYMESLENKINSGGHFASNAVQLSKVMSDREIMNAKSGSKSDIKIFEKKYPELSKEFKQIQKAYG